MRMRASQASTAAAPGFCAINARARAACCGPPIKNTVPALLRLLGDCSWHVRLQAANTLAKFGRVDDALPVIIDALRQPDYQTQDQALWILYGIGPPAAAPAS